MSKETRKVAIIGGGITGLASAYRLERLISEEKATVDYDLFEASDRLGGKIKTFRQDGFVIEQGPDSYLARKGSMTRLAEAVGLKDELTFNETGQAFILKGTSLEPIPKGSVMGIPTDLAAFMETKLLSPVGKARVLLDYVLPKTTHPDEDISAGAFFRKRLGDEAVDYLIEPLLSGIYAGDMNRLSLKATFPQFQQLEEAHRSLITGIKKSQSQTKATSNKQQGNFLTVKTGLESFVQAISNQLPKEKIHLNSSINKITSLHDAGYELIFDNGHVKRYDDVIVTLPPHHAGELLREYHEFAYLREMELSSAATVALAFKREDVSNPYNGTGFVVAKNSPVSITACTWTDKKWPHTAPAGYTLLRCYVGRYGHSEIVDESDEVITKTVLDDLHTIMGLDATPLFSKVTRFKEGMPQYQVGHTYKIEHLTEQLQKKFPGLHIVGAGMNGVGLPDCIDQGEACVEEIISKVQDSKIPIV